MYDLLMELTPKNAKGRVESSDKMIHYPDFAIILYDYVMGMSGFIG